MSSAQEASFHKGHELSDQKLGLIPRQEDVDRIASFYKALSDPTRLKIFLTLKEKNLCVGDLIAMFDISQPAISSHLKVLKNARIVKSEKQGQHQMYSLVDHHIFSLIENTHIHLGETP